MTKTKAVLLIFAICAIIYSNSLGGEFAWDDEYFIVKNTRIRNLENLPYFFTDPSTVAFGELAKDVYRPVTTVSYAIDYHLSRFNTFGYHLTNVLFHSLNAVLVFLLISYIVPSVLIALFVSLLFACHPVQTEVVSWLSGRSSVLFLFFYLASLVFYIRYSKESRRYLLWLSICAFAVSLFSKEMAVTLPLVLLLYDTHFLNKLNLKKAFVYAPYLMLTIFFLAARSSLLGRVSQTGWWGGNPYYTFLTMSKVFLGYVKILLLPVDLCAFYFIPISRSAAETGVFIAVILLIALLASLPYLYKRSRIASFAILWFFITMIPVSNIVPLKALMAERFLYLPAIGFCLLLALVLFRIGPKTIAVYIAIAITAAYSVKTMARNEEWKDSVSISKSIIKVSPLNPWGLTSLGAAQVGKKEYGDAIKSLKKAISLSPGYASAHNALGFCYLEMERYEDAIPELIDAIHLDPHNIETRNSLGVAYGSLKKYDEAEGQFKAAIAEDPRFLTAYLNLGALYEAKGEPGKALTQYETIISKTKERSEIAVAYIRIGDVYHKAGDKDKSRTYYEKALDICASTLPEVRKVVEDRLGGVFPEALEMKKK